MLSQTRRAAGGRTTSLLKPAALGLVLVAGAAGALGSALHAADRRQAQEVWEALKAAADANPPLYDPQMVEGLPEIARRYFNPALLQWSDRARHAAPPRRAARDGRDLRAERQPHADARAPDPRAFRPRLRLEAQVGAGFMRFAGSDGHHAPAGGRRDSWTKFWLHGLVSLARIVTSPNHARAAATAQDIEPMQLTLDGDGRPTEVVALRWTDANPERVYRLQPFGGRMLEKGPFGGFTIPTRVELGNLYGTPDYAPFFLATITTAELGGSSR